MSTDQSFTVKTPSSEHIDPKDRVPMSEKMIYGSGTCIDMWGHWLYPTLANAVFNIHLGLSPTWVGLANTIIRFFDLFSDPFAGWLSDRTRSRWGRRRPFIIIAGILVGLALPLLFAVPSFAQQGEFFGVPNLFWFMVATNLLFIPLVSMVNMPYQSLGAELSPDYNERTRVMAVKSVMQKVFETAFFVATFFLTLEYFKNIDTGAIDTLKAAQTYCAILGGIIILVSLLMFYRLKERHYVTVSAKERNPQGIFASFVQNMKCKPFMLLLLNGLFFVLGTGLVQSMGYYTTLYYVCGGDTTAGNRWNSLMGFAYMAGGFIGAPLFAMIGKHLDKRIAILCATGFGIAAFGGTWFTYNPDLPWLQLVGSGSIGITLSGFWMLNSSMMIDVMDYDEHKTGFRREGALGSTNSWILKVANGLGFLASGMILEATGFLASKGAQTPETLHSMRVALAGVPIIGLSISAFFILRYSLTKERMAELRAALEARRGRV